MQLLQQLCAILVLPAQMRYHDNKSNIKNQISKMKDRRARFFSGFTLIELLVVISIVGLLSAVIVPNFMGARERSRDIKRKSDIRQIQKALELYKDTQSPPAYTEKATFDALVCDSDWQTSGGSTLIKEFPCDPTLNTVYIYDRTTNLDYTLYACLENKSDPEAKAQASCASGYKYEVSNP